MERGRGLLAFVGLGLNDDRGITLEGLEEIRAADTLFAEFYTSRLKEGAIDNLAKAAGREIRILSREQVEKGDEVLAACEGKRVAFLVAGDPMTATTHLDLRLRATKAGIETKLIHSSSVLTAVPGILGLQHYKFGRTTTIPFAQEGFSPTSPLEVISENMSRGLHTLVLLDIDADNSRFMTASEAMRSLLDMEQRTRTGTLGGDTLVCVVARAGAPDSIAMAGSIRRLVSVDFGPPLHSLVVPGKLHFLEEEALDAITIL